MPRQDLSVPESIETEIEQIALHTVGIIGHLGPVSGHGIGTGVAIRWRRRCFLVTAHHVIADTPHSDHLSFLLRGHDPARTPMKIEEVRTDQKRDLALLRVAGSVASEHRIRFYPVRAGLRTPGLATEVVLLGYLPDRKGLTAVERTHITDRRPHADFDPHWHLLVPYHSADEREPHGFSGAGVWSSAGQNRLRLAGIVTHYYRTSRLLMALRVERVVELLAKSAARPAPGRLSQKKDP